MVIVHFFSILILIIGFFSTTPASAILYLEPYAGYALGTSGTTYKIDSTKYDSTGSPSGLVFGGKAGVGLLVLDFGADLMIGPNSGENTTTSLGPFLQFKLLDWFKVSATYFLLNSITNANGTGSKGTGFKLGVGFELAPFLWVNIEQIGIKYKEYTVKAAESPRTDYNSDVGLTMVSLSIPLSL